MTIIALGSSLVLFGFGIALCVGQLLAMRMSRRLQDNLRTVMYERRGYVARVEEESTFLLRIHDFLRWTGQYESCRRLTRAAGYFGIVAPARFALARMTSTVVVGLAGFWTLGHGDVVQGTVGMVGGAAIGFLGPNVFLLRLAVARRAHIFREFPIFLDIFQVLLQGGGSIEQCLRFVAQWGAEPLPQMHRTILAFVDDVDNGHDYENALRRWNERLSIDAANDVITLLRQSLVHGTELSVPLTQYAARLIDQRLLEARVLAGRRTTHVTVVMMVFLLPPLMIVIGAPAFSNVLKMFQFQ